jgi:tight adherence protein B
VDDLVSGLAADLRAGLLPGLALRLGAESLALSAAAPPVAAAVAAAAAGDDVPAALRSAPVPGGKVGMARLAAAWHVADTSGAPLSEVLDRLEADLTSLRHRRDLVDAQTTAATTTVRMLAVLPVLGLGLGYTLGGDPLGFLLHTAAGSVCALLALALQVAGLLWGEHIAAAPIRSGGV